MKRYNIINDLIKLYGFKSYLEIGYGFGETFTYISCDSKHANDLFINNENITYNMSSDEAFKIIKDKNLKYDIIFIDGYHVREQVLRDIENALECLTSNGIIVCHDMIPPTEAHSICPRITKKGEGWTGNCYLALIEFRTKYEYLVQTVDTDWGCGIIFPNKYAPKLNINDEYNNWEYFNNNKKELLNMITPEEFTKLYSF